MRQLDASVPDAVCLNCEAPLTGPYCAECGQRRVDPKETLRGMLHDVLGDVFAWDSRVARSIRWLVRRPGHLSLEWAAGRRARYVPPFRLYIWLTLVLLASNAIQRGATGWLHEHEGHSTEKVNPFEMSGTEGTPMERVNTTVKTLLDIWVRNFFVTTPIIGFFFYVFFRERRPTYPPHFVLGLELASFGVLVLLAARWLRIVWVSIPPHVPLREASQAAAFVLVGAVVLATLGVATAAIRRFYGLTWWRAALASPLLVLAPFTVLVVIAFAATFGILIFTS